MLRFLVKHVLSFLLGAQQVVARGNKGHHTVGRIATLALEALCSCHRGGPYRNIIMIEE